MKKLLLTTLALAIMAQLSHAQTNSFPASGNVGIGITNPTNYGSGNTTLSISGTTGSGFLDIYNAGSRRGYLYGTSSSLNLSSEASDLLFGTTGLERMRILNSNGNVGIGTISPSAKLEVVGNVLIGNAQWYCASATGGNVVNLLGIATDNNVYFGDLFGSIPSSRLNFRTNGSDRMEISASGNVGIAATPLSLFQVDGGCTRVNFGEASGEALNYGTSYMGFNAARTSGGWTVSGDSHNNGGGVMYANIFGDISFANVPTTSGSDQTLSDTSVFGKISLQIHRDGTTYAKKVIIQATAFPDYVFAKDYVLRPLSQVKDFIDQNHHLPEMPTAKEVEKDGMDVTEVNKVLVKKVEELTLYLIEKDRQIGKQSRQLNEQAELTRQLSKRLDALESKKK